jgi:hypothetical protein
MSVEVPSSSYLLLPVVALAIGVVASCVALRRAVPPTRRSRFAA